MKIQVVFFMLQFGLLKDREYSSWTKLCGKTQTDHLKLQFLCDLAKIGKFLALYVSFWNIVNDDARTYHDNSM